MSYRADRQFDLKNNYQYTDWSPPLHNGYSLSEMPEVDLRAWYHEILKGGMHGLCYSMYSDGQKPGDIIGIDQIRRRMSIIAPYIKWIRSFSCIEGNEYVPQVAKELGIKTLVGAWLGDDPDKNKKELDALIDLAQKGFVDIAAVGNEVMYRGDLTEEQLLECIRYVKEAIPDIPVGYVDAYYEFTERPALADISDIILTNCYPFWEGTPIEHGLPHMRSMFHQAKTAAKEKPVIITETGWPSRGQSLEASIPSEHNAMRYFIETQLWSRAENVDIFYFASFDEAWKVGPEGDVGAHWGIWDKDEVVKYGGDLS